jgi:hypothetical protein
MPGQGKGGGPAKAGRTRGRSLSSPGHLKKAAGERSARDYAPGRIDGASPAGRADEELEGTEDRARDETVERGGILGWLLRRR